MNILIVNQPVAGKAFLHVVPVRIHLPRKLGERGIGEILDRFFYSEGFQGFAQFVELFGLLQSNFFAGKTPIRQKGDVSFLNQVGSTLRAPEFD